MRPHDLLWLRLPHGAALPDWIEADWPAVVRRADPAGSGLVPVGLRGRLRNQRHADWVMPAQVVRMCSPEALARGHAWERFSGLRLACLETLGRLAPLLDEAALTWGPTGSVGFTLATGVALLRPDSDLDLLVRADQPPTPGQVALLASLKAHAQCRLDVQIDTGRGGFALDEWLAGRRRVLLKTDRGPQLVANPWQPSAEELCA